MIIHENDFMNILSCAIKREKAFNYVQNRLEFSLQDIGIEKDCFDDIANILLDIYSKKELTGAELSQKISQFQKEWRPHLNRAYLWDYERLRWEFIATQILDKVKTETHDFGRCLDIGCGRGCITESLVAKNYARYATGIDSVDFKGEWRERRTGTERLSFEYVPVQDFGSWISECKGFDTVFLFYVLHHSTDYWASRTLSEILRCINKRGQIIVLEDSLFMEEIEEHNQLNKNSQRIITEWRQWAENEHPYNRSVGFDIQVILDFVAVQMLAGFKDVNMPFNYKIASEWENIFKEVGLTVSQKMNLGFPNKRDIDVPQAVFILKPNA